MSKTTITATIASLFFLSCSSSLPYSQSSSDTAYPTTNFDEAQPYSCAANTLYALCQQSGVEISYQKCVELLPFTPAGNSMLEFKKALESLGFNVEAQRLTPEELANIYVPAVFLLALPSEKIENLGTEQVIGHYLMLWPLEEGSQIQNYPHEPVVLSTDYLIRHLRRIGVENIPVLLCGRR